MGQMTVPRWTAGFVPPGIMAKTPRMFDNMGNHADGMVDGVKQAPTLSQDEAHLDSFSSFAVIRKSASQKDPFVQNSIMSSDKGSKINGKDGRWTREVSAMLPEVEFTAHEGASSVAPTSPDRALSARRDARSNAASRASNYSARNVQSSKPAGEELSMTARLGRLAMQPPKLPGPGESGPPSPMSLGPPAPNTEDRRAAAGSRASAQPAAPPKEVPAAPQAVTVRTGGFQRVDNKFAAEAASTVHSLQPTPRNSKRNLHSGTTTPVTARSAR